MTSTSAVEDADPLVALARRPWPLSLRDEGGTHRFTRFCFLRGLGFVYAVAFYSLVRQMPGLIESQGLLPAAPFLSRVRDALGAAAYVRLPTLFWLGCSDSVMRYAAWAGVALSLGVLAGYANSVMLAALWVLYLSFVNVGQIFYGYGWELLLLEAGFLAIFFAPAWEVRPWAASPPPRAVVWLLRWVLFRVMLGAGLIKLRGDPCWVHLTCLVDHYETQPNPGPLSYYFHAMPLAFHRGGALFNHFVELVVPWGYFGTRRIRHAAGAFTIVFQVILILSGNLSFLNWLTIVVALGCFDDSALERFFPSRLRARVREIAARATGTPSGRGSEASPRVRRRVIVGLVVLVLALSVAPTVNLLSPSQTMNASFFPLPIVNTYGAFGSVEHERHEVVLDGTRDDVLSGDARWQEYEFPCKPGDPRRMPCLVTPYHYRLDWQMWFAGLSNYEHQPWIVKLVYELLRENPRVTSLLAKDPFKGTPPRYVRALLYRYRFSRERQGGRWWERELLGEYLRPLSLDDPTLREFLERRGWFDQ
ncbi:MAG TPA: lipase maturation factor family protein [Polyangiaceae bacterium]